MSCSEVDAMETRSLRERTNASKQAREGERGERENQVFLKKKKREREREQRYLIKKIEENEDSF